MSPTAPAAEGIPADGEAGAVVALLLADDDALESLDALLLTLLHLPVNPNRVAGPEVDQLLAQVLGFDVLDGAVTHDGLQKSCGA